MSENLNRSTEGFSKYDSMSIGELEEILRADAMGPERDDSDVDEILYAMEVLAKKRRQNGIAGKTALEAYQEFQQHCLPVVEEESNPKRKSSIIPFRRIAVVAASLVLIFTLTTSANAFGLENIWNAVVNWAQETFSFSTGVDIDEPNATNQLEYASLQDMLAVHGRNPNIVPLWIPDGFFLSDLRFAENPIQETYLAVFTKDNSILKICIRSYLGGEPEKIEQSADWNEVYSVSGIDYYLFSNNNQQRAAWLTDTYECNISGDLSIDEIKKMIDSIEKG